MNILIFSFDSEKSVHLLERYHWRNLSLFLSYFGTDQSQVQRYLSAVQ
ncbi:MAG: hypothetical protein R2793_00385 [Flavobacteriaceae bacterium]